MTNENAAENETQTQNQVEISDPALSFADYQKIRRGEVVNANKEKSAPEDKSPLEQKSVSDSETEKTEEKQDDSSDESDEESEDLNESEKPRKKGGFQRKIDKLTAEKHTARSEAEYYKAEYARLMALNGAGNQSQNTKQENKPISNDKPNPENFETHAEYVEALTDWKLEQKEKAQKEASEKSKAQSEQENLFKSHASRVQAFTENKKDFLDVISEVDDIQPSDDLKELILNSENGPQLMYELAKNRKEYERINGLGKTALYREIGKIEVKLESLSEKQKQEPKKITNAPKPIDPIGGNGVKVVAKSLDDPNISFADYERLRREQKKRRG